MNKVIHPVHTHTERDNRFDNHFPDSSRPDSTPGAKQYSWGQTVLLGPESTPGARQYFWGQTVLLGPDSTSGATQYFWG